MNGLKTEGVEGNLAVIWDDEEPYNMMVSIEQFEKKFGWEVETFKVPHLTLSRIVSMKDSDLAKSIIILDIMMPAADGDKIFTAKATNDGLLTGLHIARLLRQKNKLQKCKALFFYSVLASEDLVKEVDDFIQDIRGDMSGVVDFVHKGEVNFFEFPNYIRERIAQS